MQYKKCLLTGKNTVFGVVSANRLSSFTSSKSSLERLFFLGKPLQERLQSRDSAFFQFSYMAKGLNAKNVFFFFRNTVGKKNHFFALFLLFALNIGKGNSKFARQNRKIGSV